MAGYRDFRFIGSGGFSRVYTARQERFSRTVAVKVITVELSADALRRFGREQATAGRLDGHPHVIRAYESGFTEAGQPYLTMEYHERGSLADRLRREGPFPAHEVLEIGVKLACALDAAHRRGVVHRDVKPQNVLVSPFVGPVLADFGIAAVDDARLSTLTGEAFTALHVAPEVLDGLPATPSADLYSLASTLYELTTGHAPFAADGDDGLLGLMRRVRSGAVPPVTRADVPPVVADGLVALLARDPRRRPPTGVAMAEHLRQLEAAAGWAQTPLVTDVALAAADWPPATASAPSGGGPGTARAGAGGPGPGPASFGANGTAPRGGLPSAEAWALAGSRAGTAHPPVAPDVGPAPPGPGVAAAPGPAGVDGARDPGPTGPFAVPLPPTPPLPDAVVEATITRPPVARAPKGPPPEAPRRGWHRPALAAGAAVVVLGAGTAWWALDRDDAPAGSGDRPATTATTAAEGAAALPPCPPPGPMTLPDQPLVDGVPPTTLSLEVSGDGTAGTLRWDDPNAGQGVYVAYVSCDAPESGDRLAVGVVGPGQPPELTVGGLSLEHNYCFTVGVLGPTSQVTAYRNADGRSYLCLDQSSR